METQNQLIRQHLESGKTIAPLEALNRYDCLRLGARIYELKRIVTGKQIGRAHV